MTAEEPISVRVARARGCSPVQSVHGDWYCPGCGSWGANGDFDSPDSHTGRNYGSINDIVKDGNESWLTPAGSFALLSEMVDGWAYPRPAPTPRWRAERGKYECEVALPGGSEPCYGDTLPLAIANAWLSWKETRQSLVHPPGCSSHIPTRECDCKYSGRRRR